jgi:hypothetical protein
LAAIAPESQTWIAGMPLNNIMAMIDNLGNIFYLLKKTAGR